MWQHVRAVLITAHLVAVVLMALPAPDGTYDRRAWKDPTVQRELAAWAETLGTPPAELEERLWTLSQSYMGARGAVLAPFGPYYEFCGTAQSWRMFVAPHLYPSALHIDVREDGTWRPVYVERDPHHRWLASVLDSYRFRSVTFRFCLPAYGEEFADFARWTADRARRDFPRADAVRVRMHKVPTPTPDEARAGTTHAGEFVPAVELPLGAPR